MLAVEFLDLIGLGGYDLVMRDAWGGISAELTPLLEAHQLDRAVVLNGYADRRFRYRVLW